MFALLPVELVARTALSVPAPAPAKTGAAPATRAVSSTEPTIRVVRGKVAVIDVPAGFASVSLQALIAAPKGKAAPGQKPAPPQWKTVASQSMNSAAGVVRFTLPKLTARRNLRVFGTKPETLPSSFLTGISSFAPDTLSTDDPNAAGGLSKTGSGTLQLSGNASTSDLSAGGSLTTRAVSESDIWKVDGDRLYFFNSTRGLQTFDISNPDEPTLLGTLRMPGAGEEMYLLDSNHAVLLKNDTSSLWWGWYDWDVRWNIGAPLIIRGGGMLLAGEATIANASLTSSSLTNRFVQTYTDPHAVVVVDVSTGAPKALGQVPFKGWLQESRLVGQVLYVASYVSEVGDDGYWHSGLRISSFDLADPANPVARGDVVLDGWMSAVYATDQYFFAATSDWQASTVHVVDISDPTGVMVRKGSIGVVGRINDKFKMDQNGDVFTAVTETFEPSTWVPTTLVSTYSLADALKPVRLGTLKVAPGENLHATRFDGNLAYVVTAERRIIDPLAIIDLSDPAQPKELGNLIIPGFSTFIQPLGDRLVTTGLDGGRPTVALYDVSNPTKPTQLSTLSLGAADGWTWSEATWDEKAFTVLPENNLILLPVSGYDRTTGYSNGVQIIDLFRNKLAKRGVIKGTFYPRRATVHRDRIISVSATNLVTVNAANRDNPVVTSDLDISWSVERVFLSGEHLVQISGSNWYGAGGAPSVLVSPADVPDSVLASVSLPEGYILSATTRAGILYVLQAKWAQDGQVYTFSTVDLTRLPAVKVLAQVTGFKLFESYTYQVKPVWVNDRTVVFASESTRYWYYSGIHLFASSTITANVSLSLWNPYYWQYSRNLELAAFDVTLPEQPKFASRVNLGGKHAWHFGQPLAAGDSVCVSFKVLPVAEPSGADEETKAALAADEPAHNRHFLKRIDYSDSANPVVPQGGMALPGELRGLARTGALLYTVGPERDLSSGAVVGEGKFALHASGFDGSAVHLLDQLPLTSFVQPLAISGQTAFVLNPQPAQIWVPTPAEPANEPGVGETATDGGSVVVKPAYYGGKYEDNPRKSTFASYQLGEDGKFAPLQTLTLDHELAFMNFDGLAVLRANSRLLRFLDTRDPRNLVDLGSIAVKGYGGASLLNAAVDPARGVWLPLNAYGVEVISISDAQP